MSPKVVAAMLTVALNASKTNSMEGFTSQFANICETSSPSSLLMDLERLMLRSKASFPAVEAAERAIISRRNPQAAPSRSHLVPDSYIGTPNQDSDFNLHKADQLVRCYVAGGVNRAPWRTRPGNSDISEKIRSSLHTKETRHCSQCFLPGHLFRSCSTPKELVSAIRRILQWLVPNASSPMSLSGTGDPIRPAELLGAVRSFYATENFGNLDEQIRLHVNQVSSASRNDSVFSSYEMETKEPTVHYSEEPWLKVGEIGFSFLSTREDPSQHPRCLHAMPDLGNPNILGGLGWWKEYVPLLTAAGWDLPEEQQSTSKMGFGDGPAIAPVCIAKRVPLRILLKDQSSILFFADVRIVANKVGLLFGKTDMKSLRMRCDLENDSFRFANHDCPAQVIDEAHYHILLGYPQKPDPSEEKIVVLSPYRDIAQDNFRAERNHEVDASPSPNDHSLAEEPTVSVHATSASTAAPVRIADISELHRKLGCPSTAGLKLFIRDAQRSALSVDQIAEVERLVCSLCDERGPTPAKPLVALPHYRQPGVAVHMDMGSFEFPHSKHQLKALVMVDAFSLLITGDLYPTDLIKSQREDAAPQFATTSSTASDTARIYIERAEGTYATAVTDLGPQFDSVLFRTVLGRLGAECRVVPRESHWPNLAEKGIDVLRMELKLILNMSSISNEHISPDTLFQAAIKRANKKVMKQYRMSRDSIHRGNRTIETEGEDCQPLFSLCPAPAADAELEAMLNCMDEKREKVTETRARLRFLSALRSQVKQAPPQLRNGDRFLYWKTETNASKSRWTGPAVCLGQNRSLVLGLEGGHPFVVHSTRAKFHGRSALQQLQRFAHMPENPELPPIMAADQSLLTAIAEDEPNVYSISVGLPWNAEGIESCCAVDISKSSSPKALPRSELDNFDDTSGMPGEMEIVLREDTSGEILEEDQGNGTHPVLLEDSKVEDLEDTDSGQEPLLLTATDSDLRGAYPCPTKEDALQPTSEKETCQTPTEDAADGGQSSPWADDSSNPPSNHGWRRRKQAVPVYCSTTQGVRVQTAFLTNTKNKRVRIVEYSEVKDEPRFKDAMRKELASFVEFKCIEEMSYDNLPRGANVISTRWVLSEKTKPDGTVVVKARLVARGFEDLGKATATSDAPTASAAAQRLVLAALAEKQWEPETWDFKTAFLQGKDLKRDVWIVPPAEFVGKGVVWKLLKPVYGLVSAPKSWYDKLTEVLSSCGFTVCLSDDGLFRISDESGEIIGILAMHVDDAMGGGTDELRLAMKKVSATLQIGAHEKGTFTYKGLRISTIYNGSNLPFEIVLDGDDYLASTEPMNLTPGPGESFLPPLEHFEFRSVVGTISYVAGAFRPDLAMEASSLSRHLASPTIAHGTAANTILQYAKENRIVLKYRKGASALTAYTDAGAIGKCRENRSQGGRIFALTDVEGHRVAAFVFWESKVIHRVCRSSAAAECLSAVEAFDAQTWLANMWMELTGRYLGDRKSIFTDNEGLVKKVVNTALPLEKRLRTDMAILRQGLRRGDFKMTWVPEGAMLADPLSKGDIHSTNLARERLKRALTRALRSNCTFIRGVPSRTVTREDVSRY